MRPLLAFRAARRADLGQMLANIGIASRIDPKPVPEACCLTEARLTIKKSLSSILARTGWATQHDKPSVIDTACHTRENQ